ncbi:unnamed protein product [Spirodela intermedia]|uniref:non-specific serine/threonine protein kinase n=1 Tax=Spirodela intermedia TaxID=51605 RepID=A0A7I8JPJ9_SPIIN|nr:unnamed protein product [Spirodela intermedia]CAA6671362.1 unnamed protein product [Spirodela intermedia]
MRRGWRYLSGSCNLRYEKFAFFDASSLSIAATNSGDGKSIGKLIAAIIVPSLAAALFCLVIYRMRLRKKTHVQKNSVKTYLDGLETLDSTDLRLVDFETVLVATDNFSEAKKIGQGGFGVVYKALLPGGEKEVAIKRLSATSKQGLEEFENEVTLIAKLQHRNLVRVLGCCVETEEKMLIYEYMPNGSLDAIISDERGRLLLDWKTRVNIILGIARGLLYLHEDSLLKIVHRDLKPSNVMLDEEMNPKISDFGMSKIFRNDEYEANTGRLWLHGPEFVLDGVFSVKSDVYSFGVLMLEILAGKKNGRAHFKQYGQTLLRQGVRGGRPLIQDSSPPNEALRCIHIALLCIQENPRDRPTMSAVVLMLMSGQMALPEPSEPPLFSRERSSTELVVPSYKETSVNEQTITVLQPRDSRDHGTRLEEHLHPSSERRDRHNYKEGKEIQVQLGTSSNSLVTWISSLIL